MEAKKGLFSRILSRFFDDSDAELEAEKPKAKTTKAKPKSYSLEQIPLVKDASLLMISSNNKDGYIREAVVKRFGALCDPVAIPKLIERTNDCVPQVRAAAKLALLELSIPENAADFVLALPNLHHLKKCQRAKHHEIIQAIENYLVAEKNASHVVKGMQNSDRAVSKACYALVMEHNLVEPENFVLNGLLHKDSSTRIKASHFLKDLKGDLKEEALHVAIKDRHMGVRREALLQLLTTWGHDPLIKKLLFDPHPAIREIAIAHLMKSGADVQYTYLRSLSEDDPKIICRAIWGIAHLNGVECIQQIKPLTESEVPSIRKEALRAIESFKNGPKKFIDTVEWNSFDTYY